MKILFLCTGNSCRSQMAEGFARQYAGSGIAAESAGIEAHGLNPRAVTVMAEAGIDISRHTSDVFSVDSVGPSNLVVTVCDQARESCPRLPATVSQIHWSFPDPAKATGSDDEIMFVFRAVRDAIDERVRALVEGMAREHGRRSRPSAGPRPVRRH